MNGPRFFFFSVLSVLLISSASALSVFNVYVNEGGSAIFLGEADSQEGLPQGVTWHETGEVTGSTHALTVKDGAVWTFSFSRFDTDMNIFLPPGATVTSLSNGEVSIASGRIVVFAHDEVVIEYTIGAVDESSSLTTLLWILLGVIGFVVVVFIINWFNREKQYAPPEPQKHDKIEVLRGVLSVREQQIIDKLKELKKAKSSYLRRQLEMPKASFSRHIQELEKKGIIKRTGEGKNKIIELVS